MTLCLNTSRQNSVSEAYAPKVSIFDHADPEKLGKNFENVFNVFKRNIEREMEVSRDQEQKEELAEVRNFLNQTLDVEQKPHARRRLYKKLSER